MKKESKTDKLVNDFISKIEEKIKETQEIKILLKTIFKEV
jgi:regulator of sirC expression with transglutaminase-like and TPR domain